MCGLGVAVGCKSEVLGAVCKGLERFKRLERFKGFRAGKRQTWTPIRSH